MPPADRLPLVSIVTPTYRRPELLRRAVESVIAQTYAHWELVICDDEDSEGDTWAYLEHLARDDERIRVFRNDGAHGQVPNVNYAMQQARGEWIKPLYNDDALRPDCLAVLVEAVKDQPTAAMAACLADRYAEGRVVRRAKRGRRAAIERLDRKQARLAMYLQDVEIGVPSQVMVRSAIVRQGVRFANAEGIACGIDTWWYARLFGHGDLLLVNQALVEEHQGDHETLTSSVSDEAFDEELMAFRRLLWPLIDPSQSPASLAVVEQSMRLNRAIHRLYRRQPIEAMRLALRVWHPKAWSIAMHWLLRRLFPGSFELVPRVVVQP